MDDLYALEGGGSATAWQRKHIARKNREAALKARQDLRAEAKADLRKRVSKWRARWKAQAAANKAAGLPPPTKHGRPRDVKKQWLDMTGWRFGRLTVIRVAPVSKNGGQRCRTWWCKCDCGSPERRVSGTVLRQGHSLSCGCLVRERLKASWQSGKLAQRKLARNRLNQAPLSIRVADLRYRILHGKPVTRKDAKLLTAIRGKLVEDEVRDGVRRRYTSGRPMLLKPAGLRLGKSNKTQTVH
jgi:hypothetical protein